MACPKKAGQLREQLFLIEAEIVLRPLFRPYLMTHETVSDPDCRIHSAMLRAIPCIKTG